MRKLFLIILMIINCDVVFSFTHDFGNYFSVGVGELMKENNPFYSKNIFVIEVSDGVKVSEVFSANVQFIISFPDENFTYLRLRSYGSMNIFKYDWFITPSVNLSVGFENSSYFVKHSLQDLNTNDFIYKYYGIFMPYFTANLNLGLGNFFVGVGWFGGMPVLFLPDKLPQFGLAVGYPFEYVGIKNIVFDEISFYYDENIYLLSVSKRF